MQDNPYSAILNTIRKDTNEQSTASWCLGIVKSVVPLVITTGGIDLYGKDLKVNRQLLPNPEQVQLSGLTGALSATTDCATGAMTQLNVSSGTLLASGLFGGVLVPGDQVALLQSPDGQSFVVLCKVVNAE